MNFGRFQRMFALPENEYRHLKSLQQTGDPIESKFLDLSNQYTAQDTIANPTVRVKKQAETLHEMVNIKEDLKDRLISATPKVYQSRASSLFQFIGNKVNVNEKGEMLRNDGSIIDGSNIGDLIQHAVRDRRRNIIPPGWEQFMTVLRDNNVPRMILNYKTLEELKPSSSSSSSITPTATPTKSSTPKASKLKLPTPIKQRLHHHVRVIKKEPKETSSRTSSREKRYPSCFINKPKNL